MAIFFQINDRRVIPNWRDYKRTVSTGELNSNFDLPKKYSIDISKQIQDWKFENSIGMAADLIGSAYVSNDKMNAEVFKASEFIIENKTKASQPLIDLANEIIRNDVSNNINPIDNIDVTSLIDINSTEALENINDRIRDVKVNIKFNQYNAIWWVELARLYSISGQSLKAHRAMTIGVNLAPDNRFVLRSATRLFIHYDDPERALHYLRKSRRTKFDPWLLSAHIATTELLKKHQVNANIGKELVLSNKFSSFDITELSSSLGTLDFSNDAIKSSKKFFDISQRAPNDNSLAQLEWISQKDSRFAFNSLEHSNVQNSYEAFAVEQFDKKNWMQAVRNCIKWFYDLPFSSRPVILGSFVSSAFLNDHETAIKLCELGLIANPNDPTLLNNLVYAYALSNKIEEVLPYARKIENINYNELTKPSIVGLQATLGLVNFRNDNIELGIELYTRSIDNAKKINRNDLQLLATINFLRELMLKKRPEVDAIFYNLVNIDDKDVYDYVKILKEESIKMYKNYKAT